MNKIHPKTLGLYLGTECEYDKRGHERTMQAEWVFRNLYKQMQEKYSDYKDFKLILRDPESMTDKEAEELHGFEREQDTDLREAEKLMHPRVIDWLRSRGFDCGGWIIQNGETIWVPSLIRAGVAKEKGTE